MSYDTNPDNTGAELQAFSGATQDSEKRSAAARLVELGLTAFDFFVDTNGKAYGVRKGGHVAKPLSGSRTSIRQGLGGLYRHMTGKIASQNALAEAIATLEFEAHEAGEPRELFLRSARVSDDVYIDLGDTTERVIHLTAGGWDLLEADAEIPVLFRRTNVTAALPMPLRGGDLDLIWTFVNMPSADERGLVAGWLVAACLLVGLPCPILALLGEQGTAKTSSARRVFALVDPTNAAVRRPPTDIDRLLHACAHSRSVVFDNLSSIPRWLSDGLCRGVTGESDVDRSLFTDDEARLIQVQAVIGFTGIDVGALAGDLAERTLWGELEVIPPSKRRSERELNAAWTEAYPSMVGGLLDLVVLALQKLPEVDLAEKPRMADFAEVLAALDLATGSERLTYYVHAQEAVATEIVDTDRFLQAIVKQITARWSGSGKDLYAKLPRPEGKSGEFWPEQRGMSSKLRRVAPDLRKAGWTVEEQKRDAVSKRGAIWTLVPPTVTITDGEIATVELAREMHYRDINDWADAAATAGLPESCQSSHVLSLREGLRIDCFHCADFQTATGFIARVERAKAVDARLVDELGRLALRSLAQFDAIVAERANQSTEV
ncbi:hypothetical protein QFZ53_002798 [Microbacterium natoriense]|uniref:ATP-binding protein n=1 Tax=Microbacterium natoriense TaxID=284570 RepID=A0AAW8F229_9MICO|nr:hypothetical protein [Microbacterium natoriense]MDQ0648602.1 hypothetical protein [Microbacterium natoriense]